MLTFLSRLFSAGKEVTSLGLGGPGLPKPTRLVYVLLTALGTVLVTAGVLLLRKYFGAEGILVLGIICVAIFWGWVLRWLYADGRITFSLECEDIEEIHRRMSGVFGVANYACVREARKKRQVA